MLRASALGLAIIVSGAAPVLAADLFTPPPLYEEQIYVTERPSDWTGLYGGIHAGYGDFELDGEITVTDLAADTTQTIDADFRDRGILGGAQIGGNVQFGRVVAGLEADISLGEFSDGLRGTIDIAGTPVDYEADAEMSWFGTARGRLGYTFGDVLFYGTGGLAFAEIEANALTEGDPYSGAASASDTRMGWTAGAGIEALLANNLTFRTEYLYYDLGEESAAGFVTDDVALAGQEELTGHVVRAGVNYLFGM